MAVSDAALVLQTLNGDNSAFSLLYDRYAGLVRAICKDSTNDLHRASDLTQEVFLRAYAKLGELKDHERFGPWLVSIARNIGREYRRGRFRDRHLLVGLTPEEPYEHQSTQSHDRLDYLDEAISKLPPDERLALHVYYLQGKDIEQARKILGVSRSGFYRLLVKAREKIAEIIEERENQNG